jgi:hypothetical protein
MAQNDLMIVALLRELGHCPGLLFRDRSLRTASSMSLARLFFCLFAMAVVALPTKLLAQSAAGKVPIDVNETGAKCDGASDDAAAFQAAINKADPAQSQTMPDRNPDGRPFGRDTCGTPWNRNTCARGAVS